MNQTFLIQKLTWIVVALFLIVCIMGNIPIFNDTHGRSLGLLKIDFADSTIYFLTAVVGAIAAYSSAPLSRRFLIAFGFFYILDAFAGLAMSRGLLDFSIFTQEAQSPDFNSFNIAINTPHAIIATVMIVIAASCKIKYNIPVGFENI